MDPIETPIFLVGSVRSGTTLLGDMLTHHPDIAFPGEFELSVELVAPDGSLPELGRYHEWLATNRHFLWHGLEIDPALDYPALVRSFLRQMKRERAGTAKPHVGVAVHQGFEHLPGLWPEARYVHLLRDPRDVGASVVREGWAGNAFTGAERWRTTEEEWERLRAKIAPERFLEVRFEDLVADVPGVLARICAFVGVAYREEMLDYPEDSTYEPVDPSVAFRWRHTQSARDIQLGEAGAGPLLEARGYAWSGERRLAVGPLHERWLRLHCRAVRLVGRLRRYGVRLWIERRLAQALGIASWQRRIRLREHEITNRRLK